MRSTIHPMKSILVTGAASGIGGAVARLFGHRGFRVGAYDVDVEGAKRVAEGLPTAIHGRLDVTSEESWQTAVSDFAEGAGGRMDVLFNSAGILRMGRFEEISVADCRKQLDVNVMGIVLGVRACLPLLTRTNGSAIVNMSSASAIYGQPELAVYSASKFAVRGLTEALDLELRSRGIRVADIMPSYVDTPMVQSQSYRAKSLDRLGVKLTADDVAEIAWRAAHGRRLHWIPQLDIELAARLGGLLPELGRRIMRRFAA